MEERYNRIDEAIKLYKRILTIDKNNLKTLIGLGFCYKKTEQFFLMEKYFRKALTINPLNVYVLKNLAFHYYINNKYQEAIIYYLKLYKIQQQLDYDSFIFLGISFKKMREYEYATNAFEKATILNAKKTQAWKETAKLFCGLYFYEHGEKFLSKTLEIDADDHELLLLKQKIDILNDIRSRPIIIDGSNVAHNGTKSPKMKNLELLRRKLVEMKFRKITIRCGSGLYIYIDDKETFKVLRNEGAILSVPAETDDDLMIINTAIDERGTILSNDRFGKYMSQLSKSDKRYVKQNLIKYSIDLSKEIVHLIYPDNIYLTKW